VEARGEMKPGDPTFAEYMDRKIQAFHGRRGEFLSAWARERDALRKDRTGPQTNSLDQQHVYIVLHMEQLVFSTAVAVYELVLFADLEARDGTMSRNGCCTLVSAAGQNSSEIHWMETLSSNSTTLASTSMGRNEVSKARLASRAEPKILSIFPSRNAWERYSNYLRAVPKLLKSKESAFGLRLALAAFSAGILAYLEKTWQFYYEQKLIWTLIVILVSTNVGSGESAFKLAARAIATVAAMVISFIVWYIVDGHPA
jgi:hypothetical protein